MDSTRKLLSIASDPIAGASDFPVADPSPVTRQLLDLLSNKNGFFAFESALHVYPTEMPGSELTLKCWNAPTLWRAAYGGLADGPLFFAQDAFGDQFCINDETICRFNSETAELEPLAGSIEEWAHLMLSDYEFQTGYPLIHTWQQENGPIQSGFRLVPKIPFVLGGKYELENLNAMICREAMQFRGELAVQIHDLPDRSKIELRSIDRE